MEVDSDSEGGAANAALLFVRRQVFEHSLTIPALTGPLASRVDLSRVARSLRDAGNYSTDPGLGPTIVYTKLVQAMAVLADPVDESILGILVESLAVNAADAFVAAGTRHIHRTDSLANVPVPIIELLVFIKLHSISRNLMVSSRETADAVWPDETIPATVSNTPAVTLPAAATIPGPSPASMTQATAKQELSAPMSPRLNAMNWTDAGPDSPMTPRRRSRESSQLLQSPIVKASAFQDIQRETQLVVDSMADLLRVVVMADGGEISDDQSDDDILIQAHHVQHLAFLLSTRQENPSEEPLASIVTEWCQSSEAQIPLSRVADFFKTALRKGLTAESKISDPSLLELTDLERRTVIRSGTKDAEIRERDFRLARCSESYIYLLAPLSRVSLVGCVDCTVFVGAAVSLSIVGCGRVRVIAAARRFRLTNCIDSTCYLSTNRKPQIVGDNRGIQMAPYNAAYANIEENARAVGVDLAVNRWNEFSSVVNPTTDSKSPRASTSVSTIPPEKFTPFMVPIATDENPGASSSKMLMPSPQVSLPKEFMSALLARNKEVEAIKTKVKLAQAELSRRPGSETSSGGNGGRDFSVVVQEQFREWLSTSGNMRQMNDLMRLEQELAGNSKG